MKEASARAVRSKGRRRPSTPGNAIRMPAHRPGENIGVDPFELLGVAPTATIEEAEAAYHALLRVHHPDMHHAGGAQAIADAERRTRALNQAMDEIRAGYVSVASATPTSGSTTADPSWSESFETAAPSGWEEPAHAVTPCPLCDLWFSRRDELTLHVKLAHGLRLEREPRSSPLRRSALGSAVAGLQHVSLWVFAPFNALLALIVATIVATNLDMQFAYWVFAVGMSPTFMRVVDRSETDR